ncbi:MAG: 16S rRNA methyltransferase [Candidatus Lokiarchaeota archaeon]|nr:16S rRNA methyltransferase [Candidatus Lokiarchaeota archaeon]MBD3199945.1 16S rRNA methyltransferase [Candidatus Lokiarchaeota archaeon]
MPLILFLVDCGLELIPKGIRTHSSVKRNLNSKNYTSQLLDNALHHSAMKKLRNKEKRGRPDILHLCLLNALGSPLNKAGKLEIYFHTVKNRIFKVNPEIRITKNFNRFKGLMAKLLIDGEIRIKFGYLISPVRKSLQNTINQIRDSKINLFSHRGTFIKNYETLFPSESNKNQICIVGGFQKGSFSKTISNISNKLISISQYPLNAWNVVNRVLSYYEITHEVY